MKVILKNKKANFEYFINETFVAGMVLKGWMVKAILAGRASLDGVYVRVVKDEIFTVGFQVAPLEQSRVSDFSSTDVKLLLTSKEISCIIGAVSQDGFTLVPVEMQYHGSRGIKLVIALAKGKKNHDKREAIKARDLKRISTE